MNKTLFRMSAIVCALTFFVAIFGGVHLYASFSPVSHVVIDTDKSVELTLNRYDRVIVSRLYHEEGADTLTQLKLDGLPLLQAVDAIMDAAFLTDSFDPDAGVGVFVCVHGPNEAVSQTTAESLTGTVNEHLRMLGVRCRACGMACPDQFLAVGHNKDVSPGRLCMISVLEREYADPESAVYERMLKYNSRQLMRKYSDAAGF